MAKARKVYICASCGSVQHRWIGKCPDCGTWDSLEEQTVSKGASSDPHEEARAWTEAIAAPEARPIAEVGADAPPTPRMATGIGELDRVLGGGLVPGSTVLLGGEPGIGKSTLLLQAAGALAGERSPVLYVSSEESAEQVRLRAERLELAERDGLLVLSDTNLSRIAEQARKARPRAIVIDSVQMVYKGDLDAPPGSITQLRRCAGELVALAKASGIALVLVGHVTKDGRLAGPRLLEHLVDAVVNFEGDRAHAHRVVRAVKNRFGATLEIGLFEMTGRGLREAPEGLASPANSSAEPRPGTVACPVMHGSRCLLVEIQALTATGFLGAAKRKASGLDSNRLAVLIAVLEQHAELRLADRDIFTQAVGGVRVAEPAADLALLLAIAGAHLRRALEPASCVIGEVGLAGELRPVGHLEQRLREAARLGYKRAILPKAGLSPEPVPGIELERVADVSMAIQQLG